MLIDVRRRIARFLAFFVFAVTFGRVQVNSTGRPTASASGRNDTHISAPRQP